MNPKNLSINDFTYDLPEDKIAKYPLPKRDASKLLVYKSGKILQDIYRNLDQHLPTDTLLIFNNTRVIEARLLFQKITGGVIEIFCLEPHEMYPDITTGMMQRGRVLWQCLIGGASKWKRGKALQKTIKMPTDAFVLCASYVEKRTGSFIIEFSWNDSKLSFAEVLHFAGAIPLPPYIKREAEKSDAERYQTIYAAHNGSVAAPTAGLHFTEEVLAKLWKKEIRTDFVTLHVGAGTFKPVKAERMERHEMHSEWISVSIKTIENILLSLSKTIIPVGTTSLRTIETLYWLGVKCSQEALAEGILRDEQFLITQWECYQLERHNLDPQKALEHLLHFLGKNNLQHLTAKTQIIIAPSYRVRIAKALITNFHQPKSTLLLLVAAVIGNDWKKVYRYALQNDFRFLSYGDGCLLWLNNLRQELGL